MNINEAQREIRTAYMGGFAGQLVSVGIWLLSAVLYSWVNPQSGMIFLFVGGMAIFPATQLVMRLLGHSPRLSPGNPMNQLAMQVAFTVPVGFLLVGAATLAKMEWFYPAAMVVVGMHYLPFCFLYGMWQFAILAGLMISGGVVLAQYVSVGSTAGGWATGVLLIFAAVVGLMIYRDEQRQNLLFRTG